MPHLLHAPAAALLLAEGAAPTANPLMDMLPLLLMFAVIYLLLIRPMGKQEKERKKRVEQVKKGDRVVLAGGILGRVSNWDDPKIAVIEISDKVKVRVLKKEIMDTEAAALAKDDAGAAKDKGTKDKDAAQAS